MNIQLGHHTVPYFEICGNITFTYMRRYSMIIVKQLNGIVRPGDLLTSEQQNDSVPILAISVPDEKSLDVISSLINHIKHGPTPKWRYRNGD